MQLGLGLRTGKILGEVLIEKNIISPRQLDQALKRQKEEKEKYLGQILFEMGIPQDQINRALDQSDKRKPLGQVLLDLNIISSDQLEQALDKQKEIAQKLGRRPLGTLLVEMGYTTFDDYLYALSKHFNIPILSLEKFSPSPTSQKGIGEKYAVRNRVLVWQDGTIKIKLVLGEPTKSLMEELRKVFPRKRVEFYLAHPVEVDACFIKMLDPFSRNLYR